MSTVRVDIQVLRGLAVAFVVFEHLALPGFKYGYLGVDIFFVISGFLITSIVSKGLERNDFSFRQFYLRRAKRLLPASFVTILATIVAAKFFLPAMQVESMKQQVIGALTFSTNFVLLSQAGYFDIESATKPLLHMWSLAVEEQFYFVLPALLACVSLKYRKNALVVLATASFIGCLYLSASNQSAAFYLLPTRAWELLIGSIASMLVSNDYVKRCCLKLALPAFAILLATPFVNSNLPHPGIDALVVCFATAVVLIANHRLLNIEGRMLFVNKLGNLSYSLYLVHWPLIAFVNVSSDSLSLSSKITLLAASLVLAIAMYRLVEEPFRKFNYGIKPSLMIFPSSAFVLVLCMHFFLQANSTERVSEIFSPNYGLDKKCGARVYTDSASCKTSDDPSVIVWGDSFAMHNVPGISLSQKIDIRQATRSFCAPFLNAAPNTKRAQFESEARQCVAFNDSTLKFIEKTKSIDTVILAGSYWQYTVDTYETISFGADGRMQVEKSGLARAKKDMGIIVSKLKAMGKKVVVISPPPSISRKTLSCLQNEVASGVSTLQSAKCIADRPTFERTHRAVNALLKDVEKNYGVKVVYLSDYICDKETCRTSLDGVPLYRDGGHLSKVGSIKLYEKIPNVLTGLDRS